MAGHFAGNIDAYVGSRVRLRRMTLGVTQERLGDELGITFQQVQKYEKGVNRIAAGRLYHIAALLAVEVDFFFENAPDPGVKLQHNVAQSTFEDSILDFINTREGFELNRAFQAIGDPAQRRAIINLVRAINDSQRQSA